MQSCRPTHCFRGGRVLGNALSQSCSACFLKWLTLKCSSSRGGVLFGLVVVRTFVVATCCRDVDMGSGC